MGWKNLLFIYLFIIIIIFLKEFIIYVNKTQLFYFVFKLLLKTLILFKHLHLNTVIKLIFNIKYIKIK